MGADAPTPQTGLIPPPPTGHPRGGLVTQNKNLPAPPCLGEALRRGNITILIQGNFWVPNFPTKN